jgi:hypothetical protein
VANWMGDLFALDYRRGNGSARFLGSNPEAASEEELDCFVARAPRNDGLSGFRRPLHVIASASEAIQRNARRLDRFVARAPRNDGLGVWLTNSPRHCERKRSNPAGRSEMMAFSLLRATDQARPQPSKRGPEPAAPEGHSRKLSPTLDEVYGQRHLTPLP